MKKLKPSEKYPKLWAQFQELRAQKAKLEETVNPLREARDAVVAQMAPLEARARELANQLKQHMPALGELDRQISALAKAMGGRSTSDVA